MTGFNICESVGSGNILFSNKPIWLNALDYSEYPFFFQEIPRAPGESTWRFSAMVAIAGHRTGPQFRSHRAKKKLDTVIWKVVPFEAPVR
jgi:hypothetical protein